MGYISIMPSKGFRGIIQVPGDKSITHRAVMLGSISQGITKVHNYLPGEDCSRTIRCFEAMGVEIEKVSKEALIIKGLGLHGLKKPENALYAGNSGTTARLMAGILAGQSFETMVDGDESLRSRPMKRIMDPLREMGADLQCYTVEGRLPITIMGKTLKGICYRMPVASAQVKSCILLGAQYAEGVTRVYEKAPSRNHTELMLKAFGADIDFEGESIVVKPGQLLEGQEVQVPGDISSAAFFIVAALVNKNSQIRIENVGINPTRTGILDVLKSMGGDIKVENERTLGGELVGDIMAKTSALKGTTIRGDLIPRLIDEIPVLAIAAAAADGVTVIKDAAELKAKESDRLAAIEMLLHKIGVDVEKTPDGLVFEGVENFKGFTLEDSEDHRILMAAAIAASAAKGESVIKNTEWVDISFPSFWSLLEKASMS